jgi:hypothetical protein
MNGEDRFAMAGQRDHVVLIQIDGDEQDRRRADPVDAGKN